MLAAPCEHSVYRAYWNNKNMYLVVIYLCEAYVLYLVTVGVLTIGNVTHQQCLDFQVQI